MGSLVSAQLAYNQMHNCITIFGFRVQSRSNCRCNGKTSILPTNFTSIHFGRPSPVALHIAASTGRNAMAVKCFDFVCIRCLIWFGLFGLVWPLSTFPIASIYCYFGVLASLFFPKKPENFVRSCISKSLIVYARTMCLFMRFLSLFVSLIVCTTLPICQLSNCGCSVYCKISIYARNVAHIHCRAIEKPSLSSWFWAQFDWVIPSCGQMYVQ